MIHRVKIEGKKFEVCRECFDITRNNYYKMAVDLSEGGSLVDVLVPVRNALVRQSLKKYNVMQQRDDMLADIEKRRLKVAGKITFNLIT